MKFLGAFIAISSLASLALALPAAEANAAPTNKRFRLKTQVQRGGRKDLNNLYLFREPAGSFEGRPKNFKLGTPVLGPKSEANVFHFLGDSQVITTINKVEYGIITTAPNDETAAFKTVGIDENSSETAFKLDKTAGLINFDNDNTYGAWAVCYWDHAVPELFEILGDRSTASYTPPNCAVVALMPEYV